MNTYVQVEKSNWGFNVQQWCWTQGCKAVTVTYSHIIIYSAFRLLRRGKKHR